MENTLELTAEIYIKFGSEPEEMWAGIRSTGKKPQYRHYVPKLSFPLRQNYPPPQK
jgi:hypothetical protein